MAIIKTKVEGYNGVRYGIAFVDGVGESEDTFAISQCKNAGYIVEEESKKKTTKKDE